MSKLNHTIILDKSNQIYLITKKKEMKYAPNK